MKTYKQFYKYAKSLASRWRYSKQQIIKKLIYREASSIIVDRVVQTLIKEKIIDDAKAFELDVFILEEKRYGYKRIKQYLITKGYDKKLLDTYIFNKDIEVDNCNFHYNNALRKYKNHRYSDVEREKIINYLKRCGFNDKIILEVIKAGINYENVM